MQDTRFSWRWPWRWGSKFLQKAVRFQQTTRRDIPVGSTSVTVVRTSHSTRNTWRQKCQACNCNSTWYIGRTFFFRTPQRKRPFDPDFGFWHLRKWSFVDVSHLQAPSESLLFNRQAYSPLNFQRGNFTHFLQNANFSTPYSSRYALHSTCSTIRQLIRLRQALHGAAIFWKIFDK
jgi:hypothetical protein